MCRLRPITAALLLVPHVVQALSTPRSTSLLPRRTYENPLQVNLQGLTHDLYGAKTTETLTLDVEIAEAAEACYPPRLSLNGVPLTQDQRGAGHGTFPTADGAANVTASWAFTCREDDDDVAWEHDVVVSITALNGRPVTVGGGDSKRERKNGKAGPILAIGFQQTRDPHVVHVSRLGCPGHSQHVSYSHEEEHDRPKYLYITYSDSHNARGGIHALAELFSQTYYFFNPSLLLLAANTSLLLGLLFYAILLCARRLFHTTSRYTDTEREKQVSCRAFVFVDEKKHWPDKAPEGSSMQEELAGFRTAVDVIGELIAVEEEGRRDQGEKQAVDQ